MTTVINEKSRRSFIRKLMAATAATAVLASCKKDDPEKTIINLKTAIAAEAKARESYLAFSEQAEKELLFRLANMIRALAAAEDIHFKNHNNVLKKLGENEEKYDQTRELLPLNNTEENIQSAIVAETHEYEEMYPGFISTANKEDCGAAIDSFTWARFAEENHANELTRALLILQEVGNDKTLPSVWFVCPQCGGLFTRHFDKCLFCKLETDKQKYDPLKFISII